MCYSTMTHATILWWFNRKASVYGCSSCPRFASFSLPSMSVYTFCVTKQHFCILWMYFSRLLKYVARFGSAYSVICCRMPWHASVICYLLCPCASRGYSSDAIWCDMLWHATAILRRSTTCYGVFMGSRASMSSKDDALTLSLILFHIGERSFPSPRQILYTCSLFLYNDT